MKKLIIALILLLAAVSFLTSCTKKTKPAPLVVPTPQKTETVTITEGIQWFSSFADGQAEAKKLNKPIMADFSTDWCGWCKKLDKDTYTDAKVIELSKKFVCIRIDGDKSEDLVSKYSVRGYPTILFLNPDGSLLDTSVGYLPAGDFLARMQKSVK